METNTMIAAAFNSEPARPGYIIEFSPHSRKWEIWETYKNSYRVIGEKLSHDAAKQGAKYLNESTDPQRLEKITKTYRAEPVYYFKNGQQIWPSRVKMHNQDLMLVMQGDDANQIELHQIAKGSRARLVICEATKVAVVGTPADARKLATVLDMVI